MQTDSVGWGKRPYSSFHRPEDVILALEASDLAFGEGPAPKYVSHFLIGETLGEGSYGKVKEAIDTETLSMYFI